MRFLLILIFTIVFHLNGWTQGTLLYYNGFEELPILEGQIPENDTVSISIITEYNQEDFGHWSPRFRVYADRTYVEGIVSGYDLTHSMGSYNVNEFDSIMVSVDSKIGHRGHEFSVKAVLNNVDTITYLTRTEPSFAYDTGCNSGGWIICQNTLDLQESGIFNIEFILNLNFGVYNSLWSSNAYQYGVDYTIDDISIYGYTDLEQTFNACYYDTNQDGNIGAQDLLAFLEVYGTFVDCD